MLPLKTIVAVERQCSDAYEFAASADGAGHRLGAGGVVVEHDEAAAPRDGGGHGSHTASTAAGNLDTPAEVLGRDFGTISGVAPAAKIAAYKVCWETGAGGSCCRT